MKKILTITLTIYKPKLTELENFFFSVRKINSIFEQKKENLIEYIIISDNPELNVEYIDYIKKEVSEISEESNNIEYIGATENLGKTWQIIKNKNKINGTFVKFADPDDFIIPEETVDFIYNDLMDLSDNSMIINSYSRVNEEITKDNYMSLDKTVFFKNNAFNPNTTYPTKIFGQIKWDFNLLIWSDDLMGFMIMLKGAKIVEAKHSTFYMNYGHAGVSITKAQHTNMRFYNDSSLYMEKAYSLVKCDADLALFNCLTNKPSLWMAQRIFEDLDLNISLNDEERKKLKNEIILKMTKLAWDQEKFKDLIKELKF